MSDLLPEPILIPATLADYSTIQNMARFYVYDLSRECGVISDEWAIPEDGLYESFDFKNYFEDPTRKAYLIKVDEELAGSVLLNQVKTDLGTQWNMGEFFVLAKFQRKGIGQQVAQKVWGLDPGKWEVSIILENKSALKFWRNVISDYTKGDYKEEVKTVDYDAHQPRRIIFSFRASSEKTAPLAQTKIRAFEASDIDVMVEAFAAPSWEKPRLTFETYLADQKSGNRLVWVAHYQEQFAGYITMAWHSKYESFRQNMIPEIMDLNVLPPFQKKGIGSNLLTIAEEAAYERSEIVGIGVGLYGDYGSAQRLYVRGGYVPDGRGITYNYRPINPGKPVPIDDDLVLWFTKERGAS